MSNLLTNPKFEEDPIDTRPPTGWTDDSGGWVTNDYRAHEGSQSYGNRYSGDTATSTDYGSVGVYPSTKLWQDVYHNGAYQKYRASVYLLSPAGSGNGDGSGGQNQYVWEDDGRLRIVGYDINNNQIGRWESLWMGEETYTDELTWYKREVSFEAPDNLHRLRFNIDGGDGNNSTIDKDSGHGGNAGLYIDDAKLQGFSNASGTSTLQKGLVGHWTMNSEDVDSGKIRDRSPYDNHGSINGDEIFVSGVQGNSLYSYPTPNIQIPNTQEHNFSGEPFSVLVWACNLDETKGGAGIVGNSDFQGGGYMIMSGNGTDIRVSVNGSGNSSEPTLDNTAFQEGEWIHVAISHDGSSFTGYLNGSAKVTRTQNITQNSQDFYIGLGPQGGWGRSKAKIDDVRIYNRALSQPEIQRIYEQRTSAVTSVGGIDVSNVSASGGNEYTKTVTDVDYKIHEFTSDGTFTVNEGGTVDVLVVAGGGGGGGRHGAGGGAGGVIYRNSYQISSGSYSVTIGSGGSGGPGNGGPGTKGENSIFDGLTALGGGGGNSYDGNATNPDGGSGSGGAASAGSSGLQPTSTDGGFGNDGGTGQGSVWNHGGGGGAGEVGEDGEDFSGGSPGAGGDGLYFGDAFSDSFGEDGYFAGGGGGGSHNDKPDTFKNEGGKGGGGHGGEEPYDTNTDSGSTGDDGEPGIANTGGGGGGGSTNSGSGGGGGNGGSGIVLIRYKN